MGRCRLALGLRRRVPDPAPPPARRRPRRRRCGRRPRAGARPGGPARAWAPPSAQATGPSARAQQGRRRRTQPWCPPGRRRCSARAAPADATDSRLVGQGLDGRGQRCQPGRPVGGGGQAHRARPRMRHGRRPPGPPLGQRGRQAVDERSAVGRCRPPWSPRGRRAAPLRRAGPPGRRPPPRWRRASDRAAARLPSRPGASSTTAIDSRVPRASPSWTSRRWRSSPRATASASAASSSSSPGASAVSVAGSGWSVAPQVGQGRPSTRWSANRPARPGLPRPTQLDQPRRGVPVGRGRRRELSAESGQPLPGLGAGAQRGLVALEPLDGGHSLRPGAHPVSGGGRRGLGVLAQHGGRGLGFGGLRQGGGAGGEVGLVRLERRGPGVEVGEGGVGPFQGHGVGWRRRRRGGRRRWESPGRRRRTLSTQWASTAVRRRSCPAVNVAWRITASRQAPNAPPRVATLAARSRSRAVVTSAASCSENARASSVSVRHWRHRTTRSSSSALCDRVASRRASARFLEATVASSSVSSAARTSSRSSRSMDVDHRRAGVARRGGHPGAVG